jgi:hypothetical protein
MGINSGWMDFVCSDQRRASDFGPPPPPRLSTFKRKGGVRNQGHTSSTVEINTPGSMMLKAIPDPPYLSTFKRRGGGPESGMHLPDDRDQRARINGAQATRASSILLCLTNMGPFPVM